MTKDELKTHLILLGFKNISKNYWEISFMDITAIFNPIYGNMVSIYNPTGFKKLCTFEGGLNLISQAMEEYNEHRRA